MTLKKKINILLTCVGGELSPNSIEFLKENNLFSVKVIGVDMGKNAIGKLFCDKFIVVPSAKSKTYLKKIFNISNKNKVNIIIPASDEEALLLAKNRKIFEDRGIKILSSKYEALKIFSNKYETYKVLDHLNIDKKKYQLIKNKKELKNFFKKKQNEIVIKPVIARGGRGIYLIRNLAKEKIVNSGREIHLNYNLFKRKYLHTIREFPQIVTEAFQQPVYDLDFLVQKGVLKKLVLRKRIISEEPNSGHEFCKIPKSVLQKVELLSKKFDLNSLHDIDLMKNKKGDFKILEINPRPSGSVSVTCAAGNNILKEAVNMYLNKKIKREIGIKNSKIKIVPYKKLKSLL